MIYAAPLLSDVVSKISFSNSWRMDVHPLDMDEYYTLTSPALPAFEAAHHGDVVVCHKVPLKSGEAPSNAVRVEIYDLTKL